MAKLERHGIAMSCSAKGKPMQNGKCERFMRTLKQELVHGEDYATRDQAKASIFEYIETFSNRVRRHSALGYVAPDEYERAYNPTHR